MIEGRGDVGQPVLKIGGHFQRSDIQDLDAVWALDLTEDEVAWAETSLRRHLSLLGFAAGEEPIRFVRGSSCVYSLTRDEVPYVTPVVGPGGGPDASLVVVAGLSGVGAKGALAYGALAADLVLGREPSGEDDLRLRETFGFAHLPRHLEQLEAETQGVG